MSDTIETNTDNKFGPTADGVYLTPYQMTVIYHEDSIFEAAVAILGAKTQLVPIGNVADLNSVADACEHISPEVLIFGTQFSREQLNKFFDRGFHFIHVFARDIEAATAKYYCDVEEDGVVTRAPYDQRVVVFDTTTFYEHIVLLEGLAPMYLVEHFICASFPTYETILGDKNVNHATGKYLVSGLEGYDLASVLLQICATYKSFELIQKYIVKGQTICEMRESMANQKIARAIPYTLKCGDNEVSAIAFDPTGVQNEILNLLPIHPRVVKEDVKLAVMYSYELHTIDNTSNGGYRVVFMSIGGDSAIELLREFAPDTVAGSNGIASAWVSFEQSAKLLTF